MIGVSANEIWSNGSTLVQVRSRLCTYRVEFKATGEVHMTAPGLDLLIELDEDIYPLEDEEACAIILVMQQEGGIVL